MHLTKPLLFLAIFMVSYQTGSAQISQGTLVFREAFDADWSAFESLMLGTYYAEEDGDQSTEEQAKAEWAAFVNTQIAMLKAKAVLAENDSTTYIFTEHQAVALRMEEGKLRDEFWAYNIDSMQVANYSMMGNKPHKRVITSTPGSASLPWKNMRDSVVIDSNDVKEILGFPCTKYYLFHSHDAKLGTEKTSYQYELYVTDAIKFPFYIMDSKIVTPVFAGCALEIKRTDPQGAPITAIKRAVSFNEKVDVTKFELPEKFKE